MEIQTVWIASDIKTGDYLAYVDSRYNPILFSHLEKKSDMVVMTKTEFINTVRYAVYYGSEFTETFGSSFEDYRTQYINQLIK